MEIGINAKVADILDRLERDTYRISSYRFRDDVLVTYSSNRSNNILTIYSKVFLRGEPWNYFAPGNVAVSYEVFRETETRSSIKYFHDQNINHERLCYLYLARLYQAMGAEGEIEMRQKYEELEAAVNEGKHNTTIPAQDKTVDKISTQVSTREHDFEIEDKTGWDTTLINMWIKGYSRDEIALRVNVSKDRVTNRVTELRKKFGKDVVPYNKDRKKQLIKS